MLGDIMMNMEFNDMYDDNVQVRNRKNNNSSNKRILIIIFTILFLIILFFVFYKIRSYYTSYEYYEKKMVDSAIDYVKSNNIIIKSDIYLDVSKLNFKIKKNCKPISGVIVSKNNDYKPYLLCDDYDTKVVNNVSKYKLSGEEVLFLAKSFPYVEKGVIGDYHFNVNGLVGEEEGVYTLTYLVSESIDVKDVLYRKVIVIDNEEVKKNYPTIELNGEMIQYVVKGQVYNELGSVSNDLIDGDISRFVQTEGNVDTNVEGEYLLNYSITNSRGYSNFVTRKVIVVSDVSDARIGYLISPTTITSSEVIIHINVESDNFDYLVLPDGTKSTLTTLSYKVNENGSYNFTCYEKDGKHIEKEVVIENINKSIPYGTCTATLYNNKTDIVVSTNSELDIEDYTYILDNIKVENTKGGNYTSTIKKPKNVKVILKNIAGSTNEITCKIVDKSYRTTYINDKGKQCLEGYICYNQGEYTSNQIKFCSGSASNCGPISQKGCSVTSMSTIVSRYGLKSSNGNAYTPYTLTTEVYNKVCSRYCSGENVAKNVAKFLGLSASKTYNGIKKNKNKLIEFLKNDTPVLLRVGEGKYSKVGHLMSILGINAEGKVFLSNTNKNSKYSPIDNSYRWNDWVTIEEIDSGAGSGAWFIAIGQAGMYNENS